MYKPKVKNIRKLKAYLEKKMKDLLTQNADLLGLNSVTLFISFTEVEQILQIVLLLLSILYTAQRFIDYKNGKKDSK